jgi:hypothetical protein
MARVLNGLLTSAAGPGRNRRRPPAALHRAAAPGAGRSRQGLVAQARQNLTAEVRTLGNALREIKAGEHPAVQSEIAQLKEALTVLNISVDRLESARSILTDEAIGQLGRTVADALMKLRDCSSSARQVAPHRTLTNKTVG